VSDFDITSADETPFERAQFGEALRQARSTTGDHAWLELASRPNSVEGPSTADWLRRRRELRDRQVRRRTAVLDWSTSIAATALGALGLLTPNIVVSVVCIGLAVMSAGILVGSLIRGAL
jgi:hypothetical protein